MSLTFISAVDYIESLGDKYGTKFTANTYETAEVDGEPVAYVSFEDAEGNVNTATVWVEKDGELNAEW